MKSYTTTQNKVTEELFIGSVVSSRDENILLNLGITHIIIVGSYLKELFPDVK